MPIISIANLPEDAVRTMLWKHIKQILKLKLARFNPQDQGDMIFELGIKPDYTNKTIDTGNDDALSAQYD